MTCPKSTQYNVVMLFGFPFLNCCEVKINLGCCHYSFHLLSGCGGGENIDEVVREVVEGQKGEWVEWVCVYSR